MQEFGGAALVSLRGDIATAGRSPQGGWQVAAHHILDPRTLMPAAPVWASVTAVAPPVCSPTRWPRPRWSAATVHRWLSSHQAAARLVHSDGRIHRVGESPA